MNVQTTLKCLVLIIMVAASTLVGSHAVAPAGTGSATVRTITEMKPEGVELAACGFQVGEAQA
jgi:hypothetical protein